MEEQIEAHTVSNAKYTVEDNSVIDATVDGQAWSGITMESRFWSIVKDWEAGGGTIEAYEAPKPDRKSEILARLDEIDKLSIRPLRAKEAGAASEYDVAGLASLEKEAKGLRDELASL